VVVLPSRRCRCGEIIDVLDVGIHVRKPSEQLMELDDVITVFSSNDRCPYGCGA
jgi:hypothetical protein